MVKLKGPGFGLAASGSLGKAITYSTSKGRAYVKKKPTPKQPRSGPQVSMRAMMTFLSKQWNNLTDNQRATWLNSYPEPHLNEYNSFLKYNLARWRRRTGPTKQFPATGASPIGVVPIIIPTGGVRHVELDMQISGPVFDSWIFLIFHSTIGYQAPVVERLILIQRADDTDHYFWTHSPLTAGTHYYRAYYGTDEGSIAWGFSDDESAVVT